MNKSMQLFTSNKSVQEILDNAKNKCNLLVNNSTENINCMIASTLFLNNSSNIYYVASNVFKASLCYDKICKIVGYENVNFYAIDEVVACEVDAISNEFKSERINTIKSIMGTLSIILTVAYRAGDIITNPIDKLEPLQNTDDVKKDAFTLEEIKLIYKNIDPEFKSFVLIMALTGLRISEVSGVSEDNFKSCSYGEYIDVRKQFLRGELVPLKTRTSIRPIPITNEIKSLFNDIQQNQSQITEFYKSFYKKFLSFCKDNQYDEITKETVDSWLSYYPYKTNRSKSNHINLIKNLSTFIVFLGEKAFIPDEEYNFKTETYTPLTLSIKQISKGIEGIDKENNITYSVLFRLLYCCGLRPGEAVRLERNDFDTKSGDLYIKESKNYNLGPIQRTNFS